MPLKVKLRVWDIELQDHVRQLGKYNFLKKSAFITSSYLASTMSSKVIRAFTLARLNVLSFWREDFKVCLHQIVSALVIVIKLNQLVMFYLSVLVIGIFAWSFYHLLSVNLLGDQRRIMCSGYSLTIPLILRDKWPNFVLQQWLFIIKCLGG